MKQTKKIKKLNLNNLTINKTFETDEDAKLWFSKWLQLYGFKTHIVRNSNLPFDIVGYDTVPRFYKIINSSIKNNYQEPIDSFKFNNTVIDLFADKSTGKKSLEPRGLDKYNKVKVDGTVLDFSSNNMYLVHLFKDSFTIIPVNSEYKLETHVCPKVTRTKSKVMINKKVIVYKNAGFRHLYSENARIIENNIPLTSDEELELKMMVEGKVKIQELNSIFSDDNIKTSLTNYEEQL